jgi:3-oxoacyl-[acyl-carrier-protein] synthase-3
MAQISVEGMQIRGVSTVVPQQEYSNLDYELLTVAERKMLVKTTGIEKRRVAKDGVTTSDLAIQAANNLFETLEWERAEIEILIFITQSRDFYLPSTAVISQEKLKLPTSCLAFDVGLGCSGYVYGLSIMSSMMKAGGFKKGILLAGDVSTVSCNYRDKSAYPLFGDAGTATFIENTEGSNSWTFDLNSDGSGENAIKIHDGGVRNLPSIESFVEKEYEGGLFRNGFNLALSGLDIFNFSVTTVPKSILKFLDSNSKSVDSFDYFIMHQANLLMNETIRKKLKFEKEKTPYSLKDYGNTSSASIPLTMTTMKGLNKEMSLFMSGFGVGLSWANAIIENNPIEYLLLNNYKNE